MVCILALLSGTLFVHSCLLKLPSRTAMSCRRVRTALSMRFSPLVRKCYTKGLSLGIDLGDGCSLHINRK